MQKLPFFWLDPKELLEKHHQRGDPITVVLVCRDPRALVAMKIFHHCTHLGASTGLNEPPELFGCFGVRTGLDWQNLAYPTCWYHFSDLLQSSERSVENQLFMPRCTALVSSNLSKDGVWRQSFRQPNTQRSGVGRHPVWAS